MMKYVESYYFGLRRMRKKFSKRWSLQLFANKLENVQKEEIENREEKQSERNVTPSQCKQSLTVGK